MRIDPEKKEDRERVAHTLLRVTLRLAAAHGFVSLGLREVSRAADIAPTSFYRHFADMEELGHELIENVAGPFVDGWIAPERAASKPEDAVLRIAGRALAGAAEDPELMRFILAEQRGAILTFRKALAAKLSAVSRAVCDAIEGPSPEQAADAVLSLILAACAELLDRGPTETPAISERLASQIRWLLRGAGAKERP